MNVKTQLMFQGKAEEALHLYQKVFTCFEAGPIERYGKEEPNPEGSFKTCEVSFAGHNILFFDRPPVHEFSFTPAVSLFVDFDRKADLEVAFANLSDQGQVLMPLGNYGFSEYYGWLKDRFGVSWQLNFPGD